MKLIATRDFANTKVGNISSGQLFECPDNMADHFIKNKLAKVSSETPEVKSAEPKPTVFRQPTAEAPAGSASQAAPVSAPKTVKKSAAGGRKAKAKSAS